MNFAVLGSKYPNVFHSLDVWHKSKKLKKALAEVATLANFLCTNCIVQIYANRALSYNNVIPYTQKNWQVKYLANRSKIVVGVTSIWRKAVAVSKHNSYRREMASFKLGGLKIIRQTTKLNTPPIILCIRYYMHRLEN